MRVLLRNNRIWIVLLLAALLLRRENMSKGVVVHYNEDGSVSLDLHIGVDQGVNISAVARSIMKEVGYKLNKATGVPVKAVDVYVDSIIG